jgi:hypothetical protein
MPHYILFWRSDQEIWDGLDVTTHGERRNTCGILVGKPEGKRSLERPKLIREDGSVMLRHMMKWSRLVVSG